MAQDDFAGSVAHATLGFVALGLIASAVTLFVIFGLVVAVIGAAIYAAIWFYRYHQDQARIAEADRLAALERQRLIDLTKKEFPTPEEWLKGFYAELFPVGDDHIPGPLSESLLAAAHALYCQELPEPPDADTEEALKFAAQHAETFDPEFFKDTVASAFNSLLTKLPTFSRPQFTMPVAELVDLPSAIFDLVTPFRDERLFERSFAYFTTWKVFHENAVKVGGGKEPVYPQDFKSDLPKYKIAHLYLRNTAFDEILQTKVPFGFDDPTRFTHHWCMGDTGAGKTTYLSHYIVHDLERVAKKEASLIVMDSKKLIREMRTLALFGPDSPLHDRVIIIDQDHPVALNPFYLPTKQARDVITYMLANLRDASDLQKGALTFLIDAAATYDKPSLYSIRDFFALRKDELPPGFDGFDADTQFWFRNTFRNLHPATKEGMHQRIANFLKENESLARMLNAEGCVDLYTEVHEQNKVVLIDTGSTNPEETNVMGRMFIAMIDQLSNTRTRLPKTSFKPVFCVLDEAQDYVKDDERFARILEKARDQKISMTIAHHHTGQLDGRVEASLKNAGIKSFCKDIGQVEVHTRRRDYLIPVTPLDFDKEDQMHPDEYGALRARIADRYSVAARPAVTTTSTADIDEPVTKNY